MTNPFKLPTDLTGPEDDLIAKAKTGELCLLGEERPGKDDRDTKRNVIRAIVIMHLAHGGHPMDPVHPKGVQLRHAWIDDALDFQSCIVTAPLWLTGCHFTEAPRFFSAQTRLISLSGSRMPGLDMSGVTTEGPVFLRGGFDAADTVILRGAKIGGPLACEGGIFRGQMTSLDADGMTTEGSVFLSDGFEAAGAVMLRAAKIGGQLDCSGGKFRGKKTALDGDGVTTEGSVFLSDGFEAAGKVILRAAKIGGQLACSGGKFRGAETALNAGGLTTEGPVLLAEGFEASGTVILSGAKIEGQLACIGGRFQGQKTALDADDLMTDGPVLLYGQFEATGAVYFRAARIRGQFACDDGKFLGKDTALNLQKTTIEGDLFWRNVSLAGGMVDLTAARVEDLVDDVESWPELGRLRLDGFTYDGFGSSPTSFAERKQWLARQWENGPGPDFPTQPFEQLGNFYRTHGHYSDARRVAIYKNDLIGKSGQLGRFGSVLHRISGILLGYGYAPIRVFRVVPIFLVLGYFIFSWANQNGAMVPNNPVILRSDDWMYCLWQEEAGQVTATECWLRMRQQGEASKAHPRGEDFPRFSPTVYALDTFVPFVNLFQEPNWIPDAGRGPETRFLFWNEPVGTLTRLYLWLHIAVGWIVTAIFAASVTGMVKKDV